MRDSFRLGTSILTLGAVLTGCDSNPGGPAAPATPTPSSETVSAPESTPSKGAAKVQTARGKVSGSNRPASAD
jgi:hypothetical protein